MALPILDGNQSATTLSTILSSGQHITAHTVVSLGTQAITDMRGAVSGSVVSISNLPSTQTIAGTVTIGNLPDATIPKDWETIGDKIGIGLNAAGLSVDVASIPAISGTVTANLGYSSIYDDGGDSLKINISAYDGSTPQAVTDTNGLPVKILAGTVTAVNHQGTTVTTSNFTSTTPSTILASANTGREVLTIFNEGAGNLHICAGATCTTIAYQVRLSAGDYYEVPLNQTSLTHSAVFATAGTARIVQIS